MSAENCDYESCVAKIRVEKIFEKLDDHSDKITKLEANVKKNDESYMNLKMDLNLSNMESKQRDNEILNNIKNVEKTLSEKTTDRDKLDEKFLEKLDNLNNTVGDVKWKTNLTYGVLASVGLSALGILIYVFQGWWDSRDPFSEQDKKSYYDIRVKESDTIKKLETKINELRNSIKKEK